MKKGILSILSTIIFAIILLSCSTEQTIKSNADRSESRISKVKFNPELNFNSYGVEDGLISTEVLNVYNDSKGFTWIATGKGVVKFDSHSFQNYLSDIDKGLYLDGSSYFYEDSKGEFWILSGNGYLHKYEPALDAIVRVPSKLENGWSTENPLQIFEDSLSNLWIGGYGGLQYWNRETKKIKVYPITQIRNKYWLQAEKVRMEVIQKDKNGNLWLGTRKFGLVKFDPKTKSYTFLRNNEKFQDVVLNDWVTDIVPSNDGKFWIADYNNGLILFDPESMEIIKKLPFKSYANNLTNIYIRDVLKVENNLILATELSGMLIYDFVKDSIVNCFYNELNLTRSPLKSISIDQNADLWIAGEKLVHGTSEQNSFDVLPLPSSIKNDDVYSLSSNQMGEILISTPNKTIYHNTIDNTTKSLSLLSPKAIRNYGVFINNKGQKFTSDEEQIIEFDSKNGSIIKKYDSNLIVDSTKNTLRRALRFLQSSDNTIWTFDHWGRLKYIKKNKIGNVFELAQDKASKRFINVQCFLDDPQNERIIVGTSMGLASVSYDLKKISWLKLKTGSINVSKSSFSFLYRDKEGVLWCLIEGQLYLLDIENRTATLFNKVPLLERVNWVVEEPKGTLWLHCGKEVLRFLKSTNQVTSFENKNFSEGSLKKPSPVTVTQGKIYFGGINGVSVIDPQKLGLNPKPPRLYLTKLSYPTKGKNGLLNDTLVHLAKTKSIVLEHYQNDLIFFYTGIEYRNPQLSQYRFILDGYDLDWIQVGNQPYGIYTNISPGKYTFKVLAANSDGIWTNTPSTLEVHINPPWWKTWWAYIFYALFLASLIYLWMRYQVYQSTLKYKINEKLRTRISSDLHDEVGSILSGLSMKSELLSLTAPEKVQQELSKLSDMSKDAMERMRDTVWAIDSRKDNYENLFDKMNEYAQENLSFKGINFSFDFNQIKSGGFLSPEKRQNCYLIFKEAITNILKHSTASHVRVKASMEKNLFKLMISDNGKSMVSTVSAGQGTQNMKMRAEKIGGKVNISKNNGYQVDLFFPMD